MKTIKDDYVGRRNDFERRVIQLVAFSSKLPVYPLTLLIKRFVSTLTQDQIENDFSEAVYEISRNTFYYLYKSKSQQEVWSGNKRAEFENLIDSIFV